MPVVAVDPHAGGVRVLEAMRWGLVPRWAAQGGDRPKLSLINARADSLLAKPVFREAFRRRRCLVPVSGFYEWRAGQEGLPGMGTRAARGKAKSPKVPYCIRHADGDLLALAGFYESWVDRNGELARSYTIITTDPNELVAPLHDRMPAILDKDAAEAWLTTPPEAADDLLELLRPFRGDVMEAYEVSREVNDVRNDHPGLAEPLPAA